MRVSNCSFVIMAFFLSGLSAFTLLRVSFCCKHTLLRVVLSSTFLQFFSGAGCSPYGGNFFQRPRRALIFSGGGGRIQAAGRRRTRRPCLGKSVGGALRGTAPGALLVQQIAETLAELVKVFALAGE